VHNAFILVRRRLDLNFVAINITFGIEDVNVFQGLKSNVTTQIYESWASFSLGMHCVCRCTNFEG
jgi:hypothetical protein